MVFIFDWIIYENKFLYLEKSKIYRCPQNKWRQQFKYYSFSQVEWSTHEAEFWVIPLPRRTQYLLNNRVLSHGCYFVCGYDFYNSQIHSFMLENEYTYRLQIHLLDVVPSYTVHCVFDTRNIFHHLHLSVCETGQDLAVNSNCPMPQEHCMHTTEKRKRKLLQNYWRKLWVQLWRGKFCLNKSILKTLSLIEI